MRHVKVSIEKLGDRRVMTSPASVTLPQNGPSLKQKAGDKEQKTVEQTKLDEEAVAAKIPTKDGGKLVKQAKKNTGGAQTTK